MLQYDTVGMMYDTVALALPYYYVFDTRDDTTTSVIHEAHILTHTYVANITHVRTFTTLTMTSSQGDDTPRKKSLLFFFWKGIAQEICTYVKYDTGMIRQSL